MSQFLLTVAIALSLAVSAHADIVIHDNQSDFEMAAASSGKFLKGIEGFEGGTTPNGMNDAVLLPNSILRFGVPNVDSSGFGFPDGLSVPNLVLESQPEEFVLVSPGFANNQFANSSNVLATNSGELITISFLDNSKTAVGFNFGTFSGVGGIEVTVNDIDGNALFTGGFSGGGVDDLFLGILAEPGTTIGSVSVGRTNDVPFFAIDNVQIWEATAVPEPTSAVIGLVGLVGLIGRRRR